MDDARPQHLSRPGDGYLAALGYLQIGTGSLSLLMSVMLLFQAMFSHSALLGMATSFDVSFDSLDGAIATYVALQLSLGWVAGGLQLAAGISCLRSTNPRLIWAASLISLANFPHGTAAAVPMILAMRRPGPTPGLPPRADM